MTRKQFFLLILILAMAGAANAGTSSWQGDVSSDIMDGDNWSTGLVPTRALNHDCYIGGYAGFDLATTASYFEPSGFTLGTGAGAGILTVAWGY